MNIITTRFVGATHGSRFLHVPSSGDHATSTIVRIIVRHGDIVDGLAVEYSWSSRKALVQGGDGGARTEIVFDPGEFITQIEGHASEDAISQLTFVTNKRTCGPYGSGTGTTFTWGPDNGAESPPATPLRLVGFSGRSGGFLHGLQAIFGQYPAMPKSVRYAKLPESYVAASELPGAGSFSDLTSPIVIFSVGHDGLEFHAHEASLRKLPALAAAVGDQPDYGWTNTITLPDDDPTLVAALLEFLHVGTYMYVTSNGPAIPHGQFDEGRFHIGVYLVAAKYRFAALAKIASGNMRAVATELDGVGALRLWRAAYLAGLRLVAGSGDVPMYGQGQGLVMWVQGLFREAEMEMEQTMVECPMLACDLLRIGMGN